MCIRELRPNEWRRLIGCRVVNETQHNPDERTTYDSVMHKRRRDCTRRREEVLIRAILTRASWDFPYRGTWVGCRNLLVANVRRKLKPYILEKLHI